MLFVRNYFSACSEVLLKINFVISQMETYLMSFFVLNIHEATSLFDLGKPQCLYESYWPRLTSSNECRESVRHGDIKFWFSGNAHTGKHWL